MKNKHFYYHTDEHSFAIPYFKLTKKDFSKKATQGRKRNGDVRNPRLRISINKLLAIKSL